MIRADYRGFPVSASVQGDLDRIQTLWALARDRHGTDSPWLFGRYCLADVFFAPVAARIAGYGLPVGKEAATYVAAHLGDPAFQEWRAEGLKVSYNPQPYALDLPTEPWPA